MPPSEDVDASQPSGTVTLVFTDIEGSTSLLQALGDRYPEVLADHHRLIREAFARPRSARAGIGRRRAVLRVPGRAARRSRRRSTASSRSPTGAGPRAPRFATGWASTPASRSAATEGYIGLDVHRAARICAAGHGGQILISQTTRDLVAGQLRAAARPDRPRGSPAALAGRATPAPVPGHRTRPDRGLPAAAHLRGAPQQPAPRGHQLHRPRTRDRAGDERCSSSRRC